MRFGVTGASGHLGRLVTAGLTAAAGPGEVVLITRSPDALTAQPGTTVRLGDFARPETLDHAFADIETRSSLGSLNRYMEISPRPPMIRQITCVRTRPTLIAIKGRNGATRAATPL